jgi:hypothetical protein
MDDNRIAFPIPIERDIRSTRQEKLGVPAPNGWWVFEYGYNVCSYQKNTFRLFLRLLDFPDWSRQHLEILNFQLGPDRIGNIRMTTVRVPNRIYLNERLVASLLGLLFATFVPEDCLMIPSRSTV